MRSSSWDLSAWSVQAASVPFLNRATRLINFAVPCSGLRAMCVGDLRAHFWLLLDETFNLEVKQAILGLMREKFGWFLKQPGHVGCPWVPAGLQGTSKKYLGRTVFLGSVSRFRQSGYFLALAIFFIQIAKKTKRNVWQLFNWPEFLHFYVTDHFSGSKKDQFLNLVGTSYTWDFRM